MAKKTYSPHLSRRDFTKIVMTFLGSIMGAVAGVPIIGSIISPAIRGDAVDDWVSLGPLENYPIGAPTLFTFTRSKINGWERTTNSFGVYVLRESESELKIFSNVCTHLSCRVNWIEETKTYHCPCHDAEFDIHGEVVYGPPPRPLDQYEEIKVEDGNILIHLMEG
jgi:Rieske Fe-S protein